MVDKRFSRIIVLVSKIFLDIQEMKSSDIGSADSWQQMIWKNLKQFERSIVSDDDDENMK